MDTLQGYAGDIDLSRVHLETVGLFRSARKIEALGEAKRRGWYAANVHQACNRFQRFWVVCQCIGGEPDNPLYRFAGKGCGFVEMTAPFVPHRTPEQRNEH